MTMRVLPIVPWVKQTLPRFGMMLPDDQTLPESVYKDLLKQTEHKCYKSLQKHGYDVMVSGVTPPNASAPTRIRVTLYDQQGQPVPGAVGEIPITAKHLLRKIATTALSLGILRTNSQEDPTPPKPSIQSPPSSTTLQPAAVSTSTGSVVDSVTQAPMFRTSLPLQVLRGSKKATRP
jgi:hypothetical protein